MFHAVVPMVVMAAAGSSAGQAATVVQRVVVPFTIDQIFGARPVVAATINGKPYRLVLHANAGSYLQINHAEAAKVGAHDLKHRGAYGISAPGQVSDLGRDDGVVDRLAIGGWVVPTAPVAVFEVPAGGSQGMLGLPFLHDANTVLDFERHELLLFKRGAATSIAREMARRGYTPHPMIRDADDGRYLVDVTINGTTAPMVVSSVATIDLDTGFAARAGVQTGPATGSYGGPSGATGKVYTAAKPVVFHIGGWSSIPMTVSIEDTYAYSKSPRPADATTARGGALGADFMIRNGAVIDFGNAVLYLKG